MRYLCLLSLTCFLAVAAQAQQADRPPNIVLFFADDLGWNDLGSYGNQYHETPKLDKLAADGMRFTQAYSSGSSCAPTRAALMSGLNPARNGVYMVGTEYRFDVGGDYLGRPMTWLRSYERKLIASRNEPWLPEHFPIFPQVLRENGYTTAMFGKIHGLFEPHAWEKMDLPGFLNERGFDEVAVQGALHHFDFKVVPTPEELTAEEIAETYLSDYITDRSIAFIEKNRDRPFLLYVPEFLVHWPLEAKVELVEKYRQKPPSDRHNNPEYAAMVESLDTSFGRIMAKLEELDLLEETIVIVTSDNGGAARVDADGFPLENGGFTSNAPLRGQKGMFYEGGIRVPLIISWPGVIPPGTTSDEPVISTDFFPTFLELAGVSQDGYKLEGESLMPILSGDEESLQRDAIFWHFPGYLPRRARPLSVIRQGDYKLIENFEDGSLELFNLANDPNERQNIVALMPEKASELQAGLEAWRASVNAPIPKPNAAWNPAFEGEWRRE